MVIHVTEVAGASILCGITPVFFISTSEYTIQQFPPFICFPSRSVSFYSICLPLCLIVGTGVILAIIMFWILHNVSNILMSFLNLKEMHIIVNLSRF